MGRGSLPGLWLAALVLCSPGRGAADPQQQAKRTAHTVIIENMQYNPAQASGVHRGERIVWVNKDLFPHTVTARRTRSIPAASRPIRP